MASGDVVDLPALQQALAAIEGHRAMLVDAMRANGISRERAQHAVYRTRAAIRRVLDGFRGPTKVVEPSKNDGSP